MANQELTVKAVTLFVLEVAILIKRVDATMVERGVEAEPLLNALKQSVADTLEGAHGPDVSKLDLEGLAYIVTRLEAFVSNPQTRPIL